MYLRLINVKAIERQRDSYILVINNRYEKMGESLYRINKDALEIIRNLNGTKTFDDLVDMMCKFCSNGTPIPKSAVHSF